ncbi:MAG: zinc-dependent metalloprotease [Candidatus Cloacimonadales bacterium]|nr:zinc-dependent metalloprotease [Candidatus Cloacimonadales bacterium]
MKKSLVLLLFLFPLILFSQNRLDPNSVISPEEIKQALTEVKSDSVNASKGFEDLIKDLNKIEGLFTLYEDPEEGTVYMQINPDQFGVIYLCTMTRQSGDAYMFDASSMLWNFPFFFKKVNKKIQLIEKNLNFRADDDPAMHRAIEKSISNSIIASTSIVGKPNVETGAILIKAADIFVRDMANVESSTNYYKQNFTFDKDNSYFGFLKSFPQNTEIDVILHFKSNEWRDVFTLADSRSMIHKYHYSLSEIPENDYRPRVADDRIGCFMTIYQDYSNLLKEDPYIRYINRWHLEKQNPKAKLSKPKEPIVFWLENTIPEQYKKPVRDGILLWNDAFEKIGIKEAIVVKEMPDDADWDPADARYNTICWIVQPGGGYAVGPSHANPYTGQLYDADVRISTDFIRFYAQEFDEVIIPSTDKYDLEKMNINRFYEGDNYAEGLAQQMAFGWNVLTKNGIMKDTPEDLKKFVDEGIKSLVVHEVGHTLGFRHNFKASTYYTAEQLQDEEFTEKYGIVGSVMDYTPVNLAPLNGNQTSYFQTVLGPWDYWTVEYAYSIFNEKKEEEKLQEIAEKCNEPFHDYGTDEDAYGKGTNGMDPLCTTFDLGKDIIDVHSNRLELVKNWWENINENFSENGESYSKFRSAFSQGWREYRMATGSIVKFIGGVYSHRDHIGDPNGRQPFEIVPAAKQREALTFLMNNIFAEDAFDFDPVLLNQLVPDKLPKFTNSIWEYERHDYPIHYYVSWLQSIVFSQVYNPIILARICDNEVKFLPDETPFTLSELFTEVRTEIWKEVAENRNINSYRRNLQEMHLSELRKLVLENDPKAPQDAEALARFDLKQIAAQIAKLDMNNLDVITQAHLSKINDEIQSILSANLQMK